MSQLYILTQDHKFDDKFLKGVMKELKQKYLQHEDEYLTKYLVLLQSKQNILDLVHDVGVYDKNVVELIINAHKNAQKKADRVVKLMDEIISIL